MMKPKPHRRLANPLATPLDAIKLLAAHGISLNRGTALNKVVFACRKYLEETRVGTVQGEITAVCGCTEEPAPTTAGTAQLGLSNVGPASDRGASAGGRGQG